MKTTTVLQVSLVIKMKHILFVCTGNTCRSPMAEAIFNSLTWEDGHFFATSCGIFADAVTPISDNAKIVLNELGITFNTVSTPISEQIMEEADMIICMTKNHASTLLSMFPQYGAKIFVMPKDITESASFSKKSGKKSLIRETRILTPISRWIIRILSWREIQRVW